ncbi:MAG: deoxyribodipyrimidine photo-lyase [Bacteroidales bacterium]|nr:deoxyribodipyrimidine photo-lyase [Bacteroidales bacterium]
MKINIFWFRRDLRLDDNNALSQAASSGLPVLPLFIFDNNITDELPADDPRVTFIYETLLSVDAKLKEYNGSLFIMKGDPLASWKILLNQFGINAVYINKDYEPYAIQRDNSVESLLKTHGIPLLRFKDQVIFEEGEIVKSDGKPYTVYTPYKNKWMNDLKEILPLSDFDQNLQKKLFVHKNECPAPDKIGFEISSIKVKPFDLDAIPEYDKYRDYPALDKTSYLGPHLRFGTVSIRKLVKMALQGNRVFLNELIWREFFMQILFHFPHVVTGNFKPKFDNILWRNNENEFERWCSGNTGYPIVDAGMRQLNETGFMHNRVRMITAGFLCKHLLTDWRWGEAYFAQKLLDYELSSNNGNWQWAAGTGCDAAPYFRVFNPELQYKKFDPDGEYVRKWVPEKDRKDYPAPIVDHDFARNRAISAYRSGLILKNCLILSFKAYFEPRYALMFNFALFWQVKDL